MSEGLRELIAELDVLEANATPGPWAWDSRGEKVNEWALGTAFDKNGQPLSGRFTDDDAIYDEYVCSHEAATVNYTDPEFICALRNAYPKLREAAAALSGDYVRVPREIDRSKHRAALEVWNDCMMNSETLETTWAQLVRVLAAAQGREG
jgi:hypothetical protein